MAHFAELDGNNKVIRVIVVDNKNEANGENFCNKLLGGNWKQTSYNTYGGVHLKGKSPLRKNFASRGYKYDSNRDAFISPHLFPSWILNEETCFYESPIPLPQDGKKYKWNENNFNWEIK